MNLKRLAVIAALVTASGCSSTSGVLPLGPHTYRVSASRHNMAGGEPGAQADALKAAEAHCIARGKQFLATNMSSSFDRPFYNYTVNFQCLDAQDPSLQRPVYRNAPDVVIENR